MNREELEYSISQYLDGTLGPVETAALEERLATDGEARAILAEYRELNETLRKHAAVPAVDYDRLAVAISDAVSREEVPTRRLLITHWQMPAAFAAAASVILAIGIAIKLHRPTPTPPPQVAEIVVSGPHAEVANANASAVTSVTIAPSPDAAANNWRVAEDLIYRPSRVTWLADAEKPQKKR